MFRILEPLARPHVGMQGRQSMNSQVDASTASAGAFFSESRLLVPDFQRRYGWDVDQQIADFWRDLSGAIGAGDYFLGLVILSARKERLEVVDGQQRLVTLTILANVLRLIATQLGRRLVAESIRTDFLYSMDFETEEQVPRILLTDRADREDLQELLEAESEGVVALSNDSAIHAAHSYLAEMLRSDVTRHENPAIRVGQWTEFISKQLTFAVFMHPDRSAAFRVYEVINTRGKDLTPTELIKSYLIGSSDSGVREETNRRWNSIEEQLKSIGSLDQLTTFVRHVVTLDRGYVIPRELYQVVSSNYTGANGVRRLLDRLETNLPVYMQMLDPSADVESTVTQARAFILADALSLGRFRPIFLAARHSGNSDNYMRAVLRVLVPGAITGQFGTGSIDAQFARAARRLHQDRDWETELGRLEELKPTREEFILRLSRGLNKFQAHVIRSAYLQSDPLPELDGFPHQVRPRNGEEWNAFDADDYRSVGGLVANWVLTDNERRPPGARTPETVESRLIPNLVASERPMADLEHWTAARVREESLEIARVVTELWYGDR